MNGSFQNAAANAFMNGQSPNVNQWTSKETTSSLSPNILQHYAQSPSTLQSQLYQASSLTDETKSIFAPT